MPFEVAVTCTTCGGDGVEPGTQPLTLSALRRDRPPAAGLAQRLRRVRPHARVPGLRGRGQIVEHPCKDVHAAPGACSRTRTLDVDVPAGIHDGQRIRLSGEGHAGALGGRAGDVYVLVRVRPDPRFVREGNDIFSQVDLTIVQAALGATVARRDARRAGRARARRRHAAGRGHVLRGKGMPVLQGFGRGDHRVLVNVSVPRRLTDEQRRLLEEFEAASDENTYRHDEGFFDKLKSAFR